MTLITDFYYSISCTHYIALNLKTEYLRIQMTTPRRTK